MEKRKLNENNTYQIWLSGADKLDPPFDYFSFADFADISESVTNNSYSNLLYRALSKAKKSDAQIITNTVNIFKVIKSFFL
jgi:hypothetical protein